jgi:hypothetical protein
LEFGLTEVIDSVVLRPALMYACTLLVSNAVVGVLLGKLAADVTFYIPAIAAFELRRRYIR